MFFVQSNQYVKMSFRIPFLTSLNLPCELMGKKFRSNVTLHVDGPSIHYRIFSEGLFSETYLKYHNIYIFPFIEGITIGAFDKIRGLLSLLD